MRITAAQLASLLDVLYTLVIVYQEVGESKATGQNAHRLKQLKPTAKQWTAELPSLEHAVDAELTGKDTVSTLVNLGFEIKDVFEQLKLNEGFSSAELQALKAAGAYLRTDSEPALKTLMKLAGLTGSPWVSQRFRPQVGKQSDTQGRLEKLVNKMVGRKGTALTMEEAVLAKATYPEEYAEYLSLRRAFNQVWKDALVDYVRASGQKLVPFKDAKAYLDSNNIEYALTDGFDGLMDDQGRFYTRKGDLIEGVPAAVNFPQVVMNPDYPKTPWVFQAIRPNGERGAYFYTADFKKSQAKKKFEKVDGLNAKMPSIRGKWMKSVKAFDQTNPVCLASTILELLYEFSARVGTPNNPTYGIGTLLVKHLKVQPNGDVLIAYKGKDSVPHKHLVKVSDPDQKFIARNLRELIDGKEPTERVFAIGRKPVGPAYANQLFKQLSGMPEITVHKIRTYRGTKLFNELVEQELPKLQSKKNLDEKTALAVFTKIAEKVGKLLNHVRRGATGTKVTGMTAIANYIDPSSSVAYFRQLGFRPPKVLEKFDV
ncbi:topoisomerase [Achromobacter phage Motura]|uniref:Topoisomerase n=1 Tax=Achromobacter phage Motura TaxID=2591403 RepID=A0A514CSX2_9CAUD|nr:topoisomerase [Achromobacter phage Motura]QDH83578.1 topoisomerase [Achromobacter phage Motura]